MTASDSKVYKTDCLNEDGISMLLSIIPLKTRQEIKEWISGKNSPLDQQSK